MTSRVESGETLPAEYAIVNASIVVGDDLELVSPGFVHVADGVIVGAGRGSFTGNAPVVDAAGCLVVPGFINCHTHLGDAALQELGEGKPGEDLLWPPDGLRHREMAALPRSELVSGMRKAIKRMLATGTVAFADFREGGIDGVVALREAAEGLPVTCLAFGRHARFPLHDDAALAANSTGLSDAQLAEIEKVLEVADGFSPLWANDTTDLGLRQTAEVVRRHGKLLATHAGESDRYRELSIARTSQGDVERIATFLAPDFVVHMTAATSAELDRARKEQLPIVMCARTQAALGLGIPPYAAASVSGVRVVLGTDNAMISSADMLAEMNFVSRTAKALAHDPAAVEARTILASATIEAAKVLKLDDRLGSISVGKSASMAVVDLRGGNIWRSVDPLASLVSRADSGDIKAVIVDGRCTVGALGSGRP